MAYARWGGVSDVYVYDTVGGMVCCGCRMEDSGYGPTSKVEMLAHMKDHIEAGHTVPSSCIERLELEISEEEKGTSNDNGNEG